MSELSEMMARIDGLFERHNPANVGAFNNGAAVAVAPAVASCVVSVAPPVDPQPRVTRGHVRVVLTVAEVRDNMDLITEYKGVLFRIFATGQGAYLDRGKGLWIHTANKYLQRCKGEWALDSAFRIGSVFIEENIEFHGWQRRDRF